MFIAALSFMKKLPINAKTKILGYQKVCFFFFVQRTFGNVNRIKKPGLFFYGKLMQYMTRTTNFKISVFN